jgi:hypothetical protein
MPADAFGDHAGDLRRRQLSGGRQQPATMRQRPFAFLVELADHARAHVFAPVVKFLLQLVLDQLTLFLDHQDFFQSFGEAPHALGFKRPDHTDLVEANTDFGGQGVVDAQVIEGLAHVEIGLAGGYDAQPWLRCIDHDLVEAIGAAVGECSIQLVIEQAGFLQQAVVGPADVESAGGQFVIGRQDDLYAVGRDIDRGRGLDGIGHGLETHPASRIAAHGPAMQAKVEIVLHAGRHQHRHHRRLEGVFRLVGNCRGTRRMIVAGHRQDAAVLPGAGTVGMLEHVAAAIHPRPLAVPHAEDAVMLGAGGEVDLLGAPQGRGGEVFVDAGLEHDLVLRQVRLRFPQRLVEAAQRRAAVAGNIAGRV